jgi:hypothetical protein
MAPTVEQGAARSCHIVAANLRICVASGENVRYTCPEFAGFANVESLQN